MKRQGTAKNKSLTLASLLIMAITVIACSFSIPANSTGTSLLTTPPVPRWVEYESALASEFLPENITGLCEWEILGQQEQQIYVWVLCSGRSIINDDIMAASAPAVIYFGTDGSIQRVRVPRDGTLYTQDIQSLFPSAVQKQIFIHKSLDLDAHINKRFADPSIPPLIVVSGTPLP